MRVWAWKLREREDDMASPAETAEAEGDEAVGLEAVRVNARDGRPRAPRAGDVGAERRLGCGSPMSKELLWSSPSRSSGCNPRLSEVGVGGMEEGELVEAVACTRASAAGSSYHFAGEVGGYELRGVGAAGGGGVGLWAWW